MGDYNYRLAGKNKFSVVNINGKEEKVYHLKFWWKPCYSFFDNADVAQPKNFYLLSAKIKNTFADIKVNYITTCYEGTPITHVYEVINDFEIKSFGYVSDHMFGGYNFPLLKFQIAQ
jgi:hypothetical protein